MLTRRRKVVANYHNSLGNDGPEPCDDMMSSFSREKNEWLFCVFPQSESWNDSTYHVESYHTQTTSVETDEK